MYQYLLFDWDGTLANTLEVWVDSWQKASSEFGQVIDRKQAALEVFSKWETRHGWSEDVFEGFKDKVYEYVHLGYQDVELIDGVVEMLEELKSMDKKIAIVTSSSKELVRPFLEKKNLKGYFDVLYGREDIQKFKPDPEIIKLAMNKLAAGFENSLIVGDSANDVKAGRNANIGTVLFFPKVNEVFYYEDDLRELRPDFFIRDLKELVKIVS